MADISLDLDWDVSEDGSGVTVSLSLNPEDTAITSFSITGSDLIAALWDDVPPFTKEVPKETLDQWYAFGRMLKSVGEEVTSRVAFVKNRSCISDYR